MSRYVLVATDGSAPATEAVAWAARDAVLLERPLRIVHVAWRWAADVPLHTMHGTLSEYGHAVLEKAEEVARTAAPGVEVETALLSSEVIEALMAEAEDAVEIVLGRRGHTGLSALHGGSTGTALAGHLATPVIIVGEQPETAQSEIVVGFDGSDHAQAALEYAFERAVLHGARVRAVFAWQVPMFSPYIIGYAPIYHDIFGLEKKRALEALEPWREKYPQVEVVEEVVFGSPVLAITEASAHADLAVVGSRGRGGLRSALLGSVSHGVVNHAHCPVAVVRARA
ncbi:universal stress protein [Nonomuraea sp. NPDC050556]|uniref:universal stress protein n=1 Tax=Nonomuraea sp. NPDC050556 TaxID=3364369 RepID=UPI0037A03513